MSLFSSTSPTFGIDLSDLSIKIAQIKKKKKNLILTSLGSKPLPRGIINKGVINQEKEEELAEIIKSAISSVKGSKIKTKYAICSLPEEETFIKVIQIPKVQEKEIGEVVKWQIEPNFPLKIEDVYFDWQVLEPEKIDREFQSKYVSVTVAPKRIVDLYFKVFKKAGVWPVVFEPESTAVARSLMPDFYYPKPVIILDMGKCGTGFTIFSGRTILMTSHINISGQDFDKVISKELKVDIKEAEDLKKGIGLINIEKKWKTYRVVVVQKSHSREKSPKSRIDLLRAMKEEKIFDALVPILTDLAEQVQHYVEYFKDFGKVGYVPDGKIDKIFLCGGEASLIGLPKFLSSSLKLPVEIGNPLINILPPSEKIFGEIFQGKFLPYATAIGLAIRGAGQNRY